MRKSIQISYIALLFFFLCNMKIATQNFGEDNTLLTGFRLGAGVNTLYGLEDFAEKMNASMNNNPRPLFDAGLVVQKMFSNRFMLQSELNLALRSTEIQEKSSSSIYKLSRYRILGYLDWVSHFGTKIPLNDNLKCVVGAGPYFSLNLNRLVGDVDELYAVWEGEDDYDDDEYFDKVRTTYSSDDLDEYPFEQRYFDLGASLMIGLEFKRSQLNFTYSHGLLNMVQNASKIRNRAYRLSYVWYY